MIGAAMPDPAQPEQPLPGPHRASSSTAGSVLALDVGGTQVRAAVVTAGGRVLQRADRPTPREIQAEGILAAFRDLLESVRERFDPAEQGPLLGLGISAVGPLDPRRGILVEPPNLPSQYRGLALAGPLGEWLGLPVAIERDTHVAALGEWAFGAARGCTDFIYLTVSTGIGGAVVSGGRLLTGPDGVAGELGHLPVEVEGPVCGCGGHGHLEAISSGTGIARAARAAIAEGRASGLAELATRIAPTPLAAVHVAAAEDAGDPVAGEIMELARRAFAQVVVGLVDVFDPERIIVGGGIAHGQGDRWLGPARRAVAVEAFRIPAQRVTIVPPELGEDVSLVGAVALVEAALGGGAPGSALGRARGRPRRERRRRAPHRQGMRG
jgi:glucokinase